MIGAPAILTIDLAALRANWRLLARRVAPAQCAAAIKANAYGIGVEVAAPALQAAGCRDFFVSHLQEGLRARAVLGPDARIFVLNGFEVGARLEDYLGARLIPVLSSAQDLTLWGDSGRFGLHVDTGM